LFWDIIHNFSHTSETLSFLDSPSAYFIMSLYHNVVLLPAPLLCGPVKKDVFLSPSLSH
jgi:hypothetical protein